MFFQCRQGLARELFHVGIFSLVSLILKLFYVLFMVADHVTHILAVEFGDTPRAYSVLAYGQSRLSSSPWYSDQAEMFAKGEVKKVAFTEADINAQAVVRFRPGEKKEQ